MKISWKVTIPLLAVSAVLVQCNITKNEDDTNLISSGDGNSNIAGDNNTTISGDSNVYHLSINGENIAINSLDDLKVVQEKVEIMEDELQSYQQEIDEAVLANFLEEEKSKIATLVQEQNYVDAIHILQNTLCKTYPNDEELQKLLIDTIYQYLDYITQQVDILLKDYKYNEASTMVESVENLISVADTGDIATLALLRAKVDSHVEVQLCNLKIAEQGGNIAMLTGRNTVSGTLSDSEEHNYSEMNLIKKTGLGNSYLEFYLGKEYSILEVTIAVSDEEESKKDPSTVNIVGDGGTILFTSGALTRTSDVIDKHRIDVTNQDRITIVIESSSSNYSVYPLIVNPILYT